MIGYLKGTVLSKSNSAILLDVHDVGYKIHVSSDVMQKAHAGEALVVYTHTHVREDLLELYGFSDEASLALF